MEDLFIALFFISLVGLIVGLKKPSIFNRITKKEITKKQVGIIFGGALILFFVLFGVVSEPAQEIEKKAKTDLSSEEKGEELNIPEYEVVSKIEHISTRRSEDKADYFGGILFTNKEKVIEIPIEDMEKIAERIVEKEDLYYSASFYITEEAYKVNEGIFVPKENKEAIESTGGLEGNEKYVSREKREEYMDKGYIGSFEDGELNINESSDYYKGQEGQKIPQVEDMDREVEENNQQEDETAEETIKETPKTGQESEIKQETPESKEEWLKVVELTANNNKQSKTFQLSGGKQRLSYSISGDAQSEGMCVIYVMEEGKDLLSDGGHPQVYVDGNADDETLMRKSKGYYYLDLQVGWGKCEVEVYEQR